MLISAVQQSGSVIHTYVLFHYGLSEDIEYSSLCYTVGPRCLSILHISGPQPFWYQGPVSWKTLCPQTGAGVLRGMVQAVMRAMGGGRWSFTCWPAAHLLLCGPVPNRPRTGSGPWPAGWGTPAIYTSLHPPIPNSQSFPPHRSPPPWQPQVCSLCL